jgi:hypothetical protein
MIESRVMCRVDPFLSFGNLFMQEFFKPVCVGLNSNCLGSRMGR